MPSQSKKTNELQCPECGKNDFKDKRGLGSHRRNMHGVVGTAASTVASRKRHENLELTVSEVKPKKNNYKKAPVEVTAPGEVALVVQQPKAAEIPPAMLGYAMGRLESLAEQIARENILPEKEFVRLVAVNFAELTKR
jgi:hypothetical protein